MGYPLQLGTWSDGFAQKLSRKGSDAHAFLDVGMSVTESETFYSVPQYEYLYTFRM